MTLEIQVLALDKHTNVWRLNWLMGSQPSHLENWISNGSTYINKTCTDLLLLKKTIPSQK